MIRFKVGDILAEDVEALVNTVNCVGVMGRGLALQFKRAFPKNFDAYARACQQDAVRPGSMFVFETGLEASPKLIINFPTKDHWRSTSRLEHIETGLAALVDTIRERDIRSIAIPALGSGLGGLDWNEVHPLIQRALGTLDALDAVVFEPLEGRSDALLAGSRSLPRTTPGQDSLVGRSRIRSGPRRSRN